MRALPVIVDLFVLLTIFALVLFYAALGNSAPNEDSSRLTMIEVETTLWGGPAGRRNASDVMTIRAELVDETGAHITESPIEVVHPDPGSRRFLVRNAPRGAQFRMVVERIQPAAFQSDGMFLRIERFYPGHAVVQSDARIGRLDVVSMGLGE